MLAAVPLLLAAAAFPPGWVPVPANEETAVGDGLLSLAFVLRLSQSALQELERTFDEVSDPAHERYGKHLSKDQLDAMLASEETVACQNGVEAWLRGSMAPTSVLRMGGDGLHVTAAHADVERAFGLPTLRAFRRGTGGPVAYRSDATTLQMPANIEACVDVVSGVLSSELPELPNVQTAVTAGGEKATTWPAVLAKMYGLPATVPNATGSRQATANFIGQYYAKSDLDTMFAKYAPGLVGHTTLPLVGPGINDQSDPGSEASLDLQYIMPAATESVPTEFWSAQKSEQLFPWIQRVNAATSPPQVHSVSYGGMESAGQAAYLTRFNVELMKAGARGISVMVSAGDGGVGCSRDGKSYTPNYPASFPAITTVGGTTNPAAETVWKQGGGGFSNVFPRPKWQARAVESYLTSGAGASLPPPSFFNASGRGYPDVTAMSTGFVVYQGGASSLRPLARYMLLPTPRIMNALCLHLVANAGASVAMRQTCGVQARSQLQTEPPPPPRFSLASSRASTPRASRRASPSSAFSTRGCTRSAEPLPSPTSS